jgi:putative membrane protein
MLESQPVQENKVFWMKNIRRRNQQKLQQMPESVDDCVQYENYPFVQSIVKNEAIRTNSLKREGKAQIEYPRSSDGWIACLFVWKGRSLDLMIFPFTLSVLHAVLYQVIQDFVFHNPPRNMESWEMFFTFVLNSTLSLLLVFRLNRAAGRFWQARQYWGDIVARSRTIGSGILVHGSGNTHSRDEALKWLVAFAVATMEYLRGEKVWPAEHLAGFMEKEQIEELQKQRHPPMYAADKLRYYLDELFPVRGETPASVAIANTQKLDSLENQVSELVWFGGGMERIKSTPLPMVYVTHLRTFIILDLILFPWVFGPSWGWNTIPFVALSALAILGIESAASEVESPFRKDRVNALDMDSYVLGLIGTLQQQIRNQADQDIARKHEQA